MGLITSQKALEIILQNTEDWGVESIPFQESEGRVLKNTIVSDRDLPPFNRVSMDGIAICTTAYEQGIRSFKIESVQAAGSPQLTLHNTNNCIEAMTGAVLPVNADAVIPYELLRIENGIATVEEYGVHYFKNVHKQGADHLINDVLIPMNTVISPAEIGVLATVGKSMVKVAKCPKILVISTGDELVSVDKIPADHQIRRSNVHAVVSILKVMTIAATTIHISDDKDKLTTLIDGFLNNYDVLLFSGAVSKGKFDFIPDVLDTLGVDKLFHKVKQRPGKPFWFGKKNQTTVFAFPGNPVSTYASCLKYFTPWFQKSMGLPSVNTMKAVLGENVSFKPAMTYFLQVALRNQEGVLVAYPQKGNGSGDLVNLVKSDAFMELPAEVDEFKKGAVYPVILYRNVSF
ncbi:MAG: molybdopterin molybdenumtransferase MoeA [Flavobacteriaceae bacterium]|nr:MAG: molybdopterin molybdenumtransferase MoeA [Flavobacteriaceae bacterium]